MTDGAPRLPDKLSERARREYFDTKNLIRMYTGVLERAANSYAKEPASSAHTAIAATIQLLMALKTSPHLRAPLVEAAEIVQRAMQVRGIVTKEVAEKVLQSIAVTLQINAKVGMKDALRGVVGNDPAAAKSLKDFRRNMLSKDTPKGARDYYHKTMQSDFSALTAGAAIKKALTICAHARGKKV